MQPVARGGVGAMSSFRVGRRRVVATLAETLGRWAVQQGTLPLAEGGTQRSPTVRLAGLLADPAAALPLSALDPDALVALRRRRLEALASADAMLVEQAAIAAAVTELCDLHRLPWPHPLAAAASDGVVLILPEQIGAIRRMVPGTEPALDLALATGARVAELEELALWDAASAALMLPGRRIALPPDLAERLGPRPGAGLAALLRGLGMAEPALRLTALAQRLGAGSHLDEAFRLAGCCSAAEHAGPLVPWFG